ncbi:hypothetical protein CASFOL_002172 [Castilleja foliolosa]|uniref:Hcy-binding domain-containing protein n=1 Tax=Castilleja foliolosa TaxID=1961234 RepID=A0ABD3EDP7_9LAMI
MAILIAMGSESSCVQVDVLCNVVRKGHASTPSFNKQVHIDYLEAGADIIITASYQATLQGFENKGYSLEESENLLRKSVEIALEARKRYYSRCVEAVNDQNLDDRILNQRPILVAASVGSYGAYLADGSEYSGDYGDAMDLEFLKNFHRRRVRILADAGPDLIAFETVPNKLEAQAFAQLIEEEELNIPAWLSFNSKDGVNVVSGDSLSDCVAVAESTNKIVAVGINCTPHRFISDLILSIKKVDQIVLLSLSSSRITNWPDGMTVNTPEVVLLRGDPLLATQTGVCVIFMYHIPTYRLVDRPGLKNPSSNLCPEETIVSPSLMVSVVLIVSSELEILTMDSEL